MDFFKRHWRIIIELVAVIVGSIIITNLLDGLRYFQGLLDQGWIVYLESAVFVTAIVFLLREDDERASTCMEILPTLGFLGTALGFTMFLIEWGTEGTQPDLTGLQLAFLTTGQALALNAVLMFVSLAKKAGQRGWQ